MPSSKISRIATWASVPVALVVSSGLVWQASYSAFTATTSNPTSNWTAGTVQLSDDDSNTALFTTGNLKPGQTGTKCIVVTSTGNLPSAVKLYGTALHTTHAMSSWIDLEVEEGTGSTFATSGPTSCAGFTSLGTPSQFTGTLAAFGTTHTNYGNGWGTFAPGADGASRTYRFTYTLNSATPDSVQGGTASIGFTWEAQNT